MAAISLPYLLENDIKHFCTSSTGNSSSAYAQLITEYPSLKMSLFTGSEFLLRVNYEETPQIDHYVLEDCPFTEACIYAIEFADKHGLTSERGFFNPGRREGLKLAFFEACDQVRAATGLPIDFYVQAVSSAMGVWGTYKGAKELKAIGSIPQLPRLICVQQESCSPMAKAYRESSPEIRERHIFHHPNGIAKAILRGNPTKAYPYIREIVLESSGDIIAVSEEEIRKAQKQILDDEGIEICFSASAAVAGLIRSAITGFISGDDIVVTNLTGSDRREAPVPQNVIRMVKTGGEWVRAD